MTDIVGVRFKTVGKIYYFNPGNLNIEIGENVIVETARGIEFGTVVLGRRSIKNSDVVSPLKDVIRIANEEDRRIQENNRKKEKNAFNICLDKIKKHKLDMKLIEVEYTFDGNKILFYFTADGRIDFRNLVKDLATVFRTRIELRQIGVRDEAKSMGCIGVCGRCLCCSQFLGEFAPVSIKMAKEQGLSLNPTKISGTCGRLMCCLKYEQDTYEELLKITPQQGAVVRTPSGRGIVEYVNILKGLVKVKIDGDRETELREFAVKDIKIIKNTASRNDLEKIDEDILKTLEEK